MAVGCGIGSSPDDGGGGGAGPLDGWLGCGCDVGAVILPAVATAEGGSYVCVACTPSRLGIEISLASSILKEMSSLCILMERSESL